MLKTFRPYVRVTLSLCLCLLVSHLPVHYAQSSQDLYNCDANCQFTQREALKGLYAATEGKNWTVLDDAPESSHWGVGNVNSTGFLPFHCNWQGVGCCGSNGFLAVQLLDSISAAYNTVKCSTPGGVILLYLVGRNLRGTLPQLTQSWLPLASSLSYIDITGRSCLTVCIGRNSGLSLACLSDAAKPQNSYHWLKLGSSGYSCICQVAVNVKPSST